MSIRTRFKIKCVAGIVIALACAGVMLYLLLGTDMLEQDSYSAGYMTGLTAGGIIAGLAISAYSGYILSSPDRLRKAEIAMKDERTLYIRSKAATITLAIVMIALYAGGLCLSLSGREEEGRLLFGAAVLCFAVYGVTTGILKKIH